MLLTLLAVSLQLDTNEGAVKLSTLPYTNLRRY